mgnify:FL=1
MTAQKSWFFTSIDQDFTEIVKLLKPQTEGNKDCEAHRCVGFLQPPIQILNFVRDKNRIANFVLGANI